MTIPERVIGTPRYSWFPMTPLSMWPARARSTVGGMGNSPTSESLSESTTTTPFGWLAMACSKAAEGRPEALNPNAEIALASTDNSLNCRSRTDRLTANPTPTYIIRMVTATANTMTDPSLMRMDVSRSSGLVAISGGSLGTSLIHPVLSERVSHAVDGPDVLRFRGLVAE